MKKSLNLLNGIRRKWFEIVNLMKNRGAKQEREACEKKNNSREYRHRKKERKRERKKGRKKGKKERKKKGKKERTKERKKERKKDM